MKTTKLCLNDAEIIVNAGSEREKELLAIGWTTEQSQKKSEKPGTGGKTDKKRRSEPDNAENYANADTQEETTGQEKPDKD